MAMAMPAQPHMLNPMAMQQFQQMQMQMMMQQQQQQVPMMVSHAPDATLTAASARAHLVHSRLPCSRGALRHTECAQMNGNSSSADAAIAKPSAEAVATDAPAAAAAASAQQLVEQVTAQLGPPATAPACPAAASSSAMGIENADAGASQVAAQVEAMAMPCGATGQFNMMVNGAVQPFDSAMFQNYQQQLMLQQQQQQQQQVMFMQQQQQPPAAQLDAKPNVAGDGSAMSAHTFAVPMVAPEMMAMHQQQMSHIPPANGMAADAPVAHMTAAATATLSTDYAS